MSERFTLHLGDCLAVLPTLEAESIDAVVTDPPYHLTSISKRFGKAGSAPVAEGAGVFARKARGFMGKEWDGGDVAFRPETWAAVLRVMKPGAHLVAFGGSRTFHRIACAIEDSGFELRDTIMYLYGSGFPKSLNVSKGIDKALGAEPRKTGRVTSVTGNRSEASSAMRTSGLGAVGVGVQAAEETEPATAAAAAWQGFGTALKPAFEPIILARAPLRETSIVRQVLATGTGAINVDACRVVSEPGDEPLQWETPRGGIWKTDTQAQAQAQAQALGRWPANILHDGSEEATQHMGDARRYFYTAKTAREDREEGLEEADEKTLHRVNPGGLENDPRWAPVKRRNTHPTVKPTDLMSWLCRLVTPKGGLILDPFMGSGSTGKAAMLEGFRFVGIEMGAEYLEIARGRIEEAARDWVQRAARKAKRENQKTLFDAVAS